MLLKKSICILLGIWISTSTISCTTIFYKIYGIKPLREFNSRDHNSALAEMRALYDGELHSVILSDSVFRSFREVFHAIGEKNLIQPIQIYYFEQNSIVSYRANCHAHNPKWSGNIDWNFYGEFDTYPAQSAIEINDDMPTLSQVSKIYNLETPSDGGAVIFLWSNMLRRQSLTAFKTIVDNLKIAEDSKIPIHVVNIDKFYIALNEQ